MNQILITKKLYITPELKRKKNVYKFNFLISIFFICLLFSYYIYAEYDRNKSEEVSKDILANIDFGVIEEVISEPTVDTTTIKVKDNILIIALDEDEIEEVNINELINPKEVVINSITKEPVMYTSESGDTYYTDAIINIPSINVSYPVLSKTTDELLKISPCKFWGQEPNEVGNYCIVGHNYRSEKFFSKVPTLQIGDIIELTDQTTRKIKYAVYDKYIVDPTDVSCTSQLTKGKREITLITCTNDNANRHVIKARETK